MCVNVYRTCACLLQCALESTEQPHRTGHGIAVYVCTSPRGHVFHIVYDYGFCGGTRCGELTCELYTNSHAHKKHKRQGPHHRALPLPLARSDVFVYFVVFFSHIPSLLSSFRSDSGSSSWQQLDRHVRSVKYLCGMKRSHTHAEFSCAGLELFITTRSLLVSEPQDS